MKHCTGCKELRPKSKKSGKCRECRKKAVRAWLEKNKARNKATRRAYYEKNKDAIRAYRTGCITINREYTNYLKRTYGLSRGQFDLMLLNSCGLCAVCHLPFALKQEPFVDHCHATGKVRGLVCLRCNSSLVQLDALGPRWTFGAFAYLLRASLGHS